MSSVALELERRLAKYRPALDEDIARRSAGTSAHWPIGTAALDDDEADIVDLAGDVKPAGPRRSRVAVVAALAIVVGLGAVTAYRLSTDPEPLVAIAPPGASTPLAPDSDDPTADTAPSPLPPASGQPLPCPTGTGEVTTDTLYLGDPESDQNLAKSGFIFSLPAGTSPLDLATRAIGSSVLGLDCGLAATATSDRDRVLVVASPPSVPRELTIEVDLETSGDATGVIRIWSGTDFETSAGNVPSLRLTGAVPSSAVTVSVRFRKGNDVWERLSDASTTSVELSVPAGESDPTPAAPVRWVLFTLLDADGRVVGVGGSVL